MGFSWIAEKFRASGSIEWKRRQFGQSQVQSEIDHEGFWQSYVVDFDKIFSPMVKMTTLWLLLGIVVVEDLELIQLDLKKTFLHGDLDEDIYMEQPKGFVIFVATNRESSRRYWSAKNKG